MVMYSSHLFHKNESMWQTHNCILRRITEVKLISIHEKTENRKLKDLG